ncbi:MAG: hypothetical protein FWC36_00750, partial [Spirochaetes bacterium]|nr:hypothetical protein [Spirochaetota bacterium]
MNQCRKCGNTLKQNNDFCTTCGEPATTVGKLKKWLNGNFLLKSMLKIAFGTFCVVFFITLIIRVLPTI